MGKISIFEIFEILKKEEAYIKNDVSFK